MNDDLISRQAAVDALEGTDWYHQDNNLKMVHGANDAEHQAWYKSDDVYKAINSVPSAQTDLSEFADNLWRKAYERGKKNARAEIVHCKDCIHRGIVNECPFAKYAVFKNDFYSTSVTYSYTMLDSPTRIEVFCPVPDDGYCYKGDRKDDE